MDFRWNVSVIIIYKFSFLFFILFLFFPLIIILPVRFSDI